ncbi:hypothetical protein [Streptomyces sp. SM11]|uniref:hypothetical protein n=1 Tax=Streptomyces sp. SM11 TaxID=565557 RepID=UPI0015E1B966|nr:hypothetical protein [Streptomyces sp. SM11]
MHRVGSPPGGATGKESLGDGLAESSDLHGAHNGEAAERRARIGVRFRKQQDAEVILRMPGMGLIPGTELVAADLQ